jgi:hypothetical protein
MLRPKAKIGVMTFSPIVLNPGTVFQSWSLCHFIDSIPGLEAELIFYEFEQRKIFKNGKFSLATLWVLYSMWRSCNFAKKIKRYPLKKALVRNNISSINGRYDMILVGGDQVWNPILTKFDKSFFLDFAKHTKKAAYAPSIGNDDWPEELKPEIQSLLKDFEFIGIREKTSIPAVEKLTKKSIHWSLDPTFLIRKEEWSDIALPPKDKKSSYIMEYCIMDKGRLPVLVQATEHAAKELGIPAIECFGGRKRVPSAIKKRNVGADLWLGYLLNAKLVITDSFHGVAFCINNNIPFYVIISRNGNRITSILDLFGLQDRLITGIEEMNLSKGIDWEPVNKKLEEVRKENQTWLRESLHEALKDKMQI